MKKIWAISCVIGYTAFWTFGFLAAAELFGDRTFAPINAVLCVLGVGVGTYARWKLLTLPKGERPNDTYMRAEYREEENIF